MTKASTTVAAKTLDRELRKLWAPPPRDPILHFIRRVAALALDLVDELEKANGAPVQPTTKGARPGRQRKAP